MPASTDAAKPKSTPPGYVARKSWTPSGDSETSSRSSSVSVSRALRVLKISYSRSGDRCSLAESRRAGITMIKSTSRGSSCERRGDASRSPKDHASSGCLDPPARNNTVVNRLNPSSSRAPLSSAGGFRNVHAISAKERRLIGSEASLRDAWLFSNARTRNGTCDAFVAAVRTSRLTVTSGDDARHRVTSEANASTSSTRVPLRLLRHGSARR